VSQRIQRVNELIKTELSGIILKKIEFFPGVLVTVTRVETAQDFRDANVYISVFPDKDSEETMKFLQKKIGILQFDLNKLLRMHPLPRLNFLPEKETSQAGRIEEILEQLKKEEK
jgi:ribosome-binding factor A